MRPGGGRQADIKSSRVFKACKAERYSLRWTPHPVIVTIRDHKGCIRALLYSYFTTITGLGVLL